MINIGITTEELEEIDKEDVKKKRKRQRKKTGEAERRRKGH